MSIPVIETIQAADLSNHVDELLARVEDKNQHIIIRRNQRRVARLVPEIYIQVVDHLIKTDPAVADTIALMLNPEVRTAIQTSMEEWQTGKARPARKVFNEIRAAGRQ